VLDSKKIEAQRWLIEGYLHDAMYYEECAERNDPRGASKAWYLEQAKHKFEMAEWAERRLLWLLIGGA